MSDLTRVFILSGWFGDVEWIEGVYANAVVATLRCDELWKTRDSEKGPDWARGLHKFSVDEYEVIL